MIFKKVQVNESTIGIQSDDPFVKNCDREMGKLVSIIRSIDADNQKIYARSDVQSILKTIDELILERFGLYGRHITGSVGYAVTPIQPRGLSVFNGDVDQQINRLIGFGKQAKTKCKERECVRDLSDISGVINSVLSSYRALTKTLNTTGVVVDFDKAKITGLTDEFLVFFAIDLNLLIQVKGFIPEELTATLIHEIGHAFTHISESYRDLKTCGLVLETMEEVNSKDLPLKGSIKLMNKRLFGGSLETTSDDNLQTILLKSSNELFGGELNNIPVSMATESERMADEFASRFGRGGYLASGLKKLTTTPKRQISLPVIKTKSILYKLLATLVAITGGAIIMLVILLTIWAVVAFMVGFFFVQFLVGSDLSTRNIYDTTYRRLQRLKQNEIRMLRYSTDEDFIDAKLEIIKEISEIMKDQETFNLFGKLGDYLPWNISNARMTQRARELEANIDNDFHYQSEILRRAGK